MDGTKIKEALASMNERGSGEGAGYVAYGIYPEYKEYYALHVFFDHIREHKVPLEDLLEKWGTIVHDEQIKTCEQPNLRKVHTPWRYFFRPDPTLMPKSTTPEEDIITHLVMKVNSERNGALIFSSGKNLGVFKAAGWPEDVANFYRIQDYKGYLWLAHNRYPTNTAGWWGGAHPFNLLDWSVVHNGEITSYDWRTLEDIAQVTVNGWMESPGHRENILAPQISYQGIGIAFGPDDKVYATQNFC